MLIQIGENSATVTPFGSLASAGRGGNGTPNPRTIRYRTSAMKLALQFIWLRCVAPKLARPVLPTKSRPAP
jgi:hypothetical protein